MKKRFFTHPITIVVSDSMYQQLIELTQQNDYSLSEWIRKAIGEKLENQGQIYNQDKDREVTDKMTK